MAGVRADDVVESQALGGEVTGHDVRGLPLFVEFAAVGDGDGVEQVAGIFCGVIKSPERLFVRRRQRVFPGQAEVLERLGKSGSRRDGDPVGGEVGAQVPATAAAHREAAQAHAIVVDGVVRFRVGKCLEDVDFAGELEGIAEAAVRVEDDCVGRGELPGTCAALLHELEFAQFVVAAVQPDVEAPFAPRVGGKRLGDDQSVRLHRVVESGDVATHDEAGGARPRHFAVGQLRGAFVASDEQILGGFEFAWLEKDPVLQRPVNGLVIDLHVGEMVEQWRCFSMLFGQSLNRFAKCIGAFAELSADFFVQFDADGRYAGGCGDERLGRFDRLAKRSGDKAKPRNDLCREAKSHWYVSRWVGWHRQF